MSYMVADKDADVASDREADVVASVSIQAHLFIFLNYTVQPRHSQHTHTHPYEHTYANLASMSIFEN